MKTGLDHLPKAKQHELQTISAILRDTLEDFLQGKTGRRTEYRILKIILFGSHVKGTWVNDPENGYISDYDILVVVNKPTLVDEDIVWQRAEEQISRKVTSAPLGLIVHDLEDVNKRLLQGHYFFKDIREEGIELFAATPRPLAIPGNLTEAERREIAQKHYDQWFGSANDFLSYINMLIRSLSDCMPVYFSPAPTTYPKPITSKSYNIFACRLTLNLPVFFRSTVIGAVFAACNVPISMHVIRNITKSQKRN
ncbi:putative nucleotidyltransferase [Gynuella sunshinyii YC6258]|uniref:Putative nucleotidyltransferase n=1 Tax=Gynuella sunshinyii YC6258 TaxID=1445510 RepID=A0A0C5V874_9GAMM|nr:nucleotidyltransferase domain-containing protein [Gynuella sunshinyii]AJQ95600.1 putative nucleotidyltransferase [Gynuella sunshinyii YC6258]